MTPLQEAIAPSKAKEKTTADKIPEEIKIFEE